MALGAQLQKPLVTLGKSLVNPKVNSKMPTIEGKTSVWQKYRATTPVLPMLPMQARPGASKFKVTTLAYVAMPIMTGLSTDLPLNRNTQGYK